MASDKELVENFVMEFADMMSGFLEDYESYSDSLARLETNVKALHKDISSVTKIVRDGNGQPPLMTRMAILEEKASAEETTKRKYWELMLTALPGVFAMLLVL
jgi:phage-related minor tail protein